MMTIGGTAGSCGFHFRSNVIKNLYEMYKNPVNIDHDTLALGEKKLTLLQKSGASFFGSIVTAIAVTPFDVVKIRLQAQQKAKQQIISPPTITSKTTSDIYLYRNGLMDFLCECNHCKERKPQWKISHRKVTGSSHYKVIDPRLKVETPLFFKGTIDAFRKISKFEGIRSLWSGLSPTLIMSIPVMVFYFPMYDMVKYTLGFNQADTRTYYAPPLAGIICRAIVVVLFNPLELYKTKLQSEKLTYKQLSQVSRETFSQRGFSFLFKGTVPSLFRDVPFSAIYWFTYEHLKFKLMTYQERSRPSMYDSFISGALAGSVAAIVTLPFDVIKTHRQVELGQLGVNGELTSLSTWMRIKELYWRSGVRGLFTGTVPRMAKIAPACAIMISIYEGLKTFFIKYNCHVDMNEDQYRG